LDQQSHTAQANGEVKGHTELSGALRGRLLAAIPADRLARLADVEL
jgi:hypothetical protein